MSIQVRFVRAKASVRPAESTTGRSAGTFSFGRLIPMILALYLTPALLVVLLVGGIGLLVLAIARAITSIVYGRDAWPRNSVGPGSSSW
jgi:hypothetical protein